jgi:hypothetical protein
MLAAREVPVRFNTLSPRNFWRIQPEKLRFGLRSCAATVIFAVLITPGCATTHATLEIAAPSNTTAGTPFTITVTALYRGQRDTVINTSILFSSSDPAAVLPGYYTFTPADAGSHTWTNGVILRTPGAQTISASIVKAPGINGSVNVTVSSASPIGQE